MSAQFWMQKGGSLNIDEVYSVEPNWDGTIQNDGNPTPEGTYYYLVDFSRFNGTKGDLKGSLTLIRN